MPAIILPELGRLAILFGVAGLLGFSLGNLLLGLLMAALLALGRHYVLLVRLRRALDKGHDADIETAGPWRDLQQGIRRLRSSNRRRKAREQRIESRFRDAAVAMPDAAVMLSRRWQVRWCNPAAQRLLGIDCSERSHRVLLTEMVADPAFREYLLKGDFSRPLEMTSPVNASIILSLLIRPFGRKKSQRMLLARDITRIFHLDQARRDFVANVSHELRTPLTVINGYLELLVDERTERSQLQRALRQMQQQTVRMEGLLRDLLTLSRLEMGQSALPERAVAVAAMLESIMVEAESVSGSRNHVLSLDGDASLQLIGVAEELHSAFSNLVINAIKHTLAGSEVRVQWRRTPEGCELRVMDSGEGIPARHIPRLTERFYRVDTGHTGDSDSTGLGLAIVKHVLERHEGDLFIASEVGRGSTFTCRFPKHRIASVESVTEQATVPAAAEATV